MPKNVEDYIADCQHLGGLDDDQESRLRQGSEINKTILNKLPGGRGNVFSSIDETKGNSLFETTQRQFILGDLMTEHGQFGDGPLISPKMKKLIKDFQKLKLTPKNSIDEDVNILLNSALNFSAGNCNSASFLKN